MTSSSNTIRPYSDDDDRLWARVVALLEALHGRGGEASEDDDDDRDDGIIQQIPAYRSRGRIRDCGVAASGDMAIIRARCYDFTKYLFEDHEIKDQKRLLSLVENGRHEKLKALLERKPDLIRAKNNWGKTVLHLAAENGHVDTVKQLVRIIFKKKEIKAGENKEAKTLFGDTVKQLVHIISKKKESDDRDDRDLLQGKTFSGDTVLHAAAQSGHMDMVKQLVRVISKNEEGSGAQAPLLEENQIGDTAVHVAVRNGNTEVATYLIRKQPDVAYKVNNNGVSPLFLAIRGSHEYLVETLFKVLPGKDVAESIKQNLVRPEALLAHEALKQLYVYYWIIYPVLSTPKTKEDGRLYLMQLVKVIMKKLPTSLKFFQSVKRNLTMMGPFQYIRLLVQVMLVF